MHTVEMPSMEMCNVVKLKEVYFLKYHFPNTMRLRLNHRTQHSLAEENGKEEPTRHSSNKTQANTEPSTKLINFIFHSGMSQWIYQLLIGWLAVQIARSYYNIISKYYSHWQSVLSTTYSLLMAWLRRFRSTTDTIHFSVNKILQESGNWTYSLPSIPSPIE